MNKLILSLIVALSTMGSTQAGPLRNLIQGIVKPRPATVCTGGSCVSK